MDPPLIRPLDCVPDGSSTDDLLEDFELPPENFLSNGLSAGALIQTRPMVTSALYILNQRIRTRHLKVFEGFG